MVLSISCDNGAWISSYSSGNPVLQGRKRFDIGIDVERGFKIDHSSADIFERSLHRPVMMGSQKNMVSWARAKLEILFQPKPANWSHIFLQDHHRSA